MRLSIGCTLNYQVLAPSAAFNFNILSAAAAGQRVERESLACLPEVPVAFEATAKGDRLLRIEARQGPFELRYAAEVEVDRPALPKSVPAEPPAHLPQQVLAYTLPSRYCESDQLSPHAWELFAGIVDRAEQVRAVCKWVDDNLAYAPGATDSKTSAWDVWKSRKGVCRDYTHLAIALCRALSIPARYVGCYAAGLEPMDFHACMEAWLAGEWRLFDPSDGIAPERIVIAARGRDAASAGLTTIFGKVQAGAVSVTCEPA